MRVIVLALALALVVGSQATISPYFATSATSTYKYEAMLLGGLPEPGLARAGLKIRSNVLIRKVNDDFILKLSGPEIFEYSDIWPRGVFLPSIKLTASLASQLTTPIRFEYNNGLVGKIYAPGIVSVEVLNVIKAIASSLSTVIKKNHSIYELQEQGIQGLCKTKYTIDEDVKTDRVVMTKTRDLSECQKRIFKNIGLSYMQKCPECIDNKKILEGTSRYKYVMKRTPQGSRILSVDVKEHIKFSPIDIMNGAVQMESWQSLEFLNVSETQLEPASDSLDRGSVQYEFANELLQTPLRLLKINNAEAQVLEILDNLAKYNGTSVRDDVPLKFIELIQVLRFAPFETIKNLWTHHNGNPSYRNLILNAIPAIGSHTAVRFLKEEFVAQNLTVAEATQALMASVHMVTPDVNSIKLFKSFFEVEKIFGNPVLRQVVMLGYGTLVSKYCVENSPCSVEHVKPIHDMIDNAVKKGAVEEIIISTKVLGNAGHAGSLKTLRKLLPVFDASAATMPTRVHIEATLALRKLARTETKRVLDIVLPLFWKRDLDVELRIAAVHVLFETKMDLCLALTLADYILEKEENMQIASFVYSYMKAMTNATTPDHDAYVYKTVTEHLEKSLRKQSPLSRFFYLDKYHKTWMLGAAVSAAYINEATMVLPKAIMAKARAYLAGAYTDVIEIGVRTEGIQEALLKMKDQNSQRINNIQQIVKALAGWRASPSSQPLGSVYVKVLGHEIAYVDIDKALVEKVTEYAKGSMIDDIQNGLAEALKPGITMHLVKPMLATEIRHIFPTIVGLPMEASIYTAVVASAPVNIESKVTPTLQRNYQISQLLNSDVTIKAEIAPSANISTYAVFGVNSAFIQTTLVSKASAYAVLPEAITAIINCSAGHVKFDFQPFPAISNIVSASVNTYAVVRNKADIPAEKLTPLFPSHIGLELKEDVSWMTSASSDYSKSSEIRSSNQQVVNQNVITKGTEERRCRASESFGVKACIVIESQDATCTRRLAFYEMIERRFVSLEVAQTSGPSVNKIEIEIQVEDKEVEKMLKTIELSEEEDVFEDKTVLMKLQKILIPKMNSSSSSSSSSSRSSASSSSSSSASSSMSKTVDVKTGIHKKSKRISSSSSKSSVRSSSSSINVSSSSRSSRSSSSSSSSSGGSSSSYNSSLSSSSSSSSSMSQADLADSFDMKFTGNHVPQGKSSASSLEAIHNAKSMARSVSRLVTFSMTAIRSDHRRIIYVAKARINKEDKQLEISVYRIFNKITWGLDVMISQLSDHRTKANFNWGLNFSPYRVVLLVDTGKVDKEPAIQLRMTMEKFSRRMKKTVKKKFHDMISQLPCEEGKRVAKAMDDPMEINVTASVAEKRLSVKLLSEGILSKCTVPLPLYLPVGETAAEVQLFSNSWLDQFSYILSKSAAAECTVLTKKIVTFNNYIIKAELPHSCNQVLAQDCSRELKFLVLLKRDEVQAQNLINVMIADLNIDMNTRNNAVELRINGMPAQLRSLIYQHPNGQIHIRQKGEGVALHAPAYGLQEIYFDTTVVKVQVVDWMKGQTCGLCGRADGEVKQELRMPSGRLTKSAVSYAHSWAQPGKSCRDSTGCLMKHESVKLDKMIFMEGEESKCYSVEPVFRCLPGCMPLRTTQVKIGFHCVPADTRLNRSEMQNSMFGKSVDVREKAEAHLACRCSPQCS